MRKLFMPMLENVSRKVEIFYVVALGLLEFILIVGFAKDALPMPTSLAIGGVTTIGFAYTNKNILIGRDIKAQVGLVILFFAISAALSVPVQNEAGILDDFLSALPGAISLSEGAFSVFTSYLASAIWEEMLFRKYLLGRCFPDLHSPFKKVIVCTTIFAALHLQGFVGAFIVGAFLGLLYLRFNSILLCVFFHLIYNLAHEFFNCKHWICTSDGGGIEQAIGYSRGSMIIATLALIVLLSVRPKKLLTPLYQ